MTLQPCEASQAFAAMIEMARADGRVVSEEREMIATFAALLGIGRRQSRRYWRTVRKARGIPANADERLALLSMLARVACADGELSTSEHRFLEAMADELGIQPLRLTEVLGQVQHDMHHRRDQHRRWWIAAVALVAVAVTVGLIAMRKGDEMAGFKELEDRHRGALALVHTEFRMTRPGAPPRVLTSSGTGFFVSADGLLATNKHVVRPWLFPGRAQELLEAGYTVDEAGAVTRVYREGARLRGRDGELTFADAFCTADKTLTLVAQGPDVLETQRVMGTDGSPHDVRCHARDNNDLVLMRCEGVRYAQHLEFADPAEEVRVLDPVMVLGYPSGIAIQERTARSSPTVGRIRSVGDTLHFTAPIVGGNSGGPLLDANGRVLGIATRTRGDSTFGCCIRSAHVARLLR